MGDRLIIPTLRPFLYGFEPGLYDRLEQFCTTEEQMPDEYKIGARPLHGDWALFKETPRRMCARRVPLPFKVLSGPSHKEMIVFDKNYPLSPEHEIVYSNVRAAGGVIIKDVPHVYADYGDYGTVKYGAWIDGKWRHVFTKMTYKTWGGRRFSHYRGLHQDLHCSLPDDKGYVRSDIMCWIEPPTASWIKES